MGLNSFQEVLKRKIYIQNVTADIERRWSVKGSATLSTTSRHLESPAINVFQTQTRFLRDQLSLAVVQPPIISKRQADSEVEPQAELSQGTNVMENLLGGHSKKWEEIKFQKVKGRLQWTLAFTERFFLETERSKCKQLRVLYQH